MKVTDHVKGFSDFIYFRANNLWYRTDDTGFEFPVPSEDTTGATFDARHKSMTLMRWIRKHVATISEGEKETVVPVAPNLFQSALTRIIEEIRGAIEFEDYAEQIVESTDTEGEWSTFSITKGVSPEHVQDSAAYGLDPLTDVIDDLACEWLEVVSRIAVNEAPDKKIVFRKCLITDGKAWIDPSSFAHKITVSSSYRVE